MDDELKRISLVIFGIVALLALVGFILLFSETTKTELSWVDSDATCDPVHIIDETVTYRVSPSSELRLTVKNLFNTEVTLPSYYYSTDGGIVREGRNYFLSYIQKF